MRKLQEMKKRAQKNNKGFSMIELIIVIAIMAILVAIIGTQLIPYMQKSRESKDAGTMDAILTNFKSAASDLETTPAASYSLATASFGLTGKAKSTYDSLAIGMTTLNDVKAKMTSDIGKSMTGLVVKYTAATDSWQIELTGTEGKILVDEKGTTVTKGAAGGGSGS